MVYDNPIYDQAPESKESPSSEDKSKPETLNQPVHTEEAPKVGLPPHSLTTHDKTIEETQPLTTDELPKDTSHLHNHVYPKVWDPDVYETPEDELRCKIQYLDIVQRLAEKAKRKEAVNKFIKKNPDADWSDVADPDTDLNNYVRPYKDPIRSPDSVPLIKTESHTPLTDKASIRRPRELVQKDVTMLVRSLQIVKDLTKSEFRQLMWKLLDLLNSIIPSDPKQNMVWITIKELILIKKIRLVLLKYKEAYDDLEALGPPAASLLKPSVKKTPTKSDQNVKKLTKKELKLIEKKRLVSKQSPKKPTKKELKLIEKKRLVPLGSKETNETPKADKTTPTLVPKPAVKKASSKSKQGPKNTPKKS